MNTRPVRLGTVGKSLTHDEWLRLRSQGIGGSDAAAVAGASDWASPMSVYLEKIGVAPAIEINEAMYWGTQLENAVATEFQLENATRVIGRQILYRCRQYPFMMATRTGSRPR